MILIILAMTSGCQLEGTQRRLVLLTFNVSVTEGLVLHVRVGRDIACTEGISLWRKGERNDSDGYEEQGVPRHDEMRWWCEKGSREGEGVVGGRRKYLGCRCQISVDSCGRPWTVVGRVGRRARVVRAQGVAVRWRSCSQEARRRSVPYTRRGFPAPLPRSHQERLTQEIAQHRCILVHHGHSFRFLLFIILRSTVTPRTGSKWNAMHARQSCSGKRMPAQTEDRHERSERLRVKRALASQPRFGSVTTVRGRIQQAVDRCDAIHSTVSAMFVDVSMWSQGPGDTSESF